MTDPRALGVLERPLSLRCDSRVFVAEFEGELVDERNVDRLEKLAEDDAFGLASEGRESALTAFVGLHVEVSDDGGCDGRVAEHLGDVGVGGVGDLLEKRPLVPEDNVGESVLARDPKEGLARLVKALEGGRERRGRGEEDRTEDGEVRLDEGVRFDTAVLSRLTEL